MKLWHEGSDGNNSSVGTAPWLSLSFQTLEVSRRCKKILGCRSIVELPVSDGLFGVKCRGGWHWQNLSIWLSESVILGVSRLPEKVTIRYKRTENAEFAFERASDLGHFGCGPTSAIVQAELVIQPKS